MIAAVERVEVAVIGGGINGCATAWALAREGHDVVLFERFEIGHTNGSSHGSARIFRESYGDPRYVQMVREAIPLWRELEDESDEQLLAVTGAVNLGDLTALQQAMTAAGSPFEILDRGDIEARFGDLEVGNRAILDTTAGVVFAERAWHAFAERARAHGAIVHERSPATPVVEDGGVRVGDVFARAAVITAGSWVRDLVPDLAVRPTRETVAYYDLGELPPVLIDWREPLVYGLPTPEGTYKAGRHIAGPTAHPDDEGDPDESSARAVDAWIGERLPHRAPARVHAETCMYTNTADESFLLTRRGPLVIGSPCSGHGFKFAPLTGYRIAELALQS